MRYHLIIECVTSKLSYNIAIRIILNHVCDVAFTSHDKLVFLIL